MTPLHIGITLALIALEWLDFSLYLYMAGNIFSKVYFPPNEHSLTLTFAIFAVAYLARPLGGWFLGRMADRNGRRHPMLLSALLMGCATLGIALLPGYHQWGTLAPCLLLFLRIIQGIALGGEVNTAAMYLIEITPKRPLLAGGLAAASGAFGMFIGGLVSAIIATGGGQTWRWFFALCGLLAIGIYYLRRQLPESPEFKQSTLDVKTIFRRHQAGLICIGSTAMFVSVMVYMCNIFWVSYASQYQLWPKYSLSLIAAFAQLSSALLAIPLCLLLEKTHVKRLMRCAFLCTIVAAPLLFIGTQQHITHWVINGLGAYILGNACLCSAMYYYLYLQIPADCRCFAVSALWAICASIGALALPLAQALLKSGWINFAPVLVICSAIFAWIGLHSFAKENNKKQVIIHT